MNIGVFMGLRPGRCYKKFDRPYTRQSQKKPRKGYIKGVPKHNISQFEMGKKKNYSHVAFLITKEDAQIRHNALESFRVTTIQKLEKTLSKGGLFFFKIRIFPHHVLRENAMATGAGADRFQQGMRASFGKPISTAARVRVGQKMFEIQVNKANIIAAKKALLHGSYKLPVKTHVVIEEIPEIKE